MRLTSHKEGLKVLNETELDSIIDTAFKILEKTGFMVEHDGIMRELEKFGARTDHSGRKVFISKKRTEDFLKNMKRNRYGFFMSGDYRLPYKAVAGHWEEHFPSRWPGH